MKKTNQNQLTLKLTFTDPTPAVLRDIATLMEVANSEAKASGDTSGLNVVRAANAVDADGESPERRNLRRLAGCVAIARRLAWHTVWVMAYHEFHAVTGNHPVVESMRQKLPTHLDYVFQVRGEATLRQILENMLMSSASIV
jgi:hypothetical protein